MVYVQLWARGSAVQPPVYLRVYPHTAYAVRIGARCELRGASTVEGEDDEESDGEETASPNKPRVPRTGSVTVQEILDDDRCVVRVDNVTGDRAVDRLTIDVRPDTVMRTTMPQYEPGTRLIALRGGRFVDCVVHRCLSLDVKESKGGPKLKAQRAEGTRHLLTLGAEPPPAGALAAAGDESSFETLDLNEFNHCMQRQLKSGEWMSWQLYDAACSSYREQLTTTSSTIKDLSTGKRLQTMLQEATCSVKERGARSEWSAVENLADIALVFAKAGQNRALGVREPHKCILSVGKGFEQEWALRQCVCYLMRETRNVVSRTAFEGRKTFKRKRLSQDAVRLVPLVISIKEVVRKLRTVPQTTTLVSLVSDHRLCEWYIENCQLLESDGKGGSAKGGDEDQIRAMLQQALEMRALVVILEYDEHLSEKSGMTLTRLLQGELLQSGNRLLVLCRPESMDSEAELQELEHSFVVLQLRSLQLNLRGCHLLDFDGARFLTNITGGSVFSSDVTALHLGDNPGLGYESGRIMSELLKGKCAVQWLDLQATNIDGRSLAYALKINSTLTYLDVRDTPYWDDQVFQALGHALLEKNSKSQLSYLRCDTFDLLPAMTTLSLQEVALAMGTFLLLAALVRHNTELCELDLSATDTDERGAEALGIALEANTSLTRLTLRYNHLDDEAQRLVRSAAAPTLELLI